LKNAIIVKLKYKFDLPKIGRPYWVEELMVFDGDPMNRPYEIIECKRKC